MFGHQQDEPKTEDNITAPQATVDPVSDGTLDDNLAALANSDDDQQTPAPDAPALIEDHETDGQPVETSAPAVVVDDTDDAPSAPATAPAPVAADTNTLLDIKQQALQQLSPLVGHLDQSPEEKFRTTMMMIQASDNQDLIKTAYEAAEAITDEKTRAQALLDIVNEINYFTQHNQD